ncbi:50S ribosomal protein L9 [Deltaproteobacteria bacterium PRO3]|nr:50S ribosomal protein L9 [Deltaproteobacteria bacterium PRO3]
MQVILREDIPTLGKAGEVVKVRDGYGRNYLLPRKMAVLADAKNLKAVEAQKKQIEAQRAKDRQKADEAAAKLASLELTIAREVGSNDRLFGSVTKVEISAALREKGVQIDKHLIELAAPIKTIGTYEVGVKLHPEIRAAFKLWVVRQEKK